MISKNKAGFTINDKPGIMLNTVDFNNSLVCMPFVRVEIHRRGKLFGNIVKNGSEFLALGRNSNMGNIDIVKKLKHKRNITSRAFPDEILIKD